MYVQMPSERGKEGRGIVKCNDPLGRVFYCAVHKSRSVSSGWSTSALLPKADIGQRIKHVCVTLKRAKCSGKLHPSARRRLPPAFVLELTIAESKRAGSAFKEISP